MLFICHKVTKYFKNYKNGFMFLRKKEGMVYECYCNVGLFFGRSWVVLGAVFHGSHFELLSQTKLLGVFGLFCGIVIANRQKSDVKKG